jgi:hypothetical protein
MRRWALPPIAVAGTALRTRIELLLAPSPPGGLECHGKIIPRGTARGRMLPEGARQSQSQPASASVCPASGTYGLVG